MPARSNDFQRVIYYVRQHIAPDAVVRESVMLTDKTTGEPREVDVLVEGTMGGERIAIAIEVRDHARKPGVQWVEEVRGKYADLPVDKVVMVSRSGFTAAALRKAAAHGIEALTPFQEISRYGPLARLAVEVEARTISWLRYVDGLAYLSDQKEPVRVAANTLLFDPENSEAGTVELLVQQTMAEQDLSDLYTASDPGHRSVRLTIDPMATRSATGEQFRPRVRFAHDNSLHAVERLEVVWEVEVTHDSVEFEHGSMRGTPFAYGNVELVGEKRLVVVTGEPLADSASDGEVVLLDRDQEK